tara:strand:- start:3377 stop:3802 length:426 start_codon:yes stop_codon:yes gene_type:complete
MEDDIMNWFDIIKNVEIDETELNAREFAEENCCANIWKSIAQEQREVFNYLRKTPLWHSRKTTEGCSMLIEWLREGAVGNINTTAWDFPTMGVSSIREEDYNDWITRMGKHIYNQKKGWLQDYVDCRNLQDNGNRPQLGMY